MAISNVKTDILTILGEINESSGYNHTPVKIGGVVKRLDEVKDFPTYMVTALHFPTTILPDNEPRTVLNYAITAYASVDKDIDDEGLLEDYLTEMYEDVIKAFKENSSSNVESIEVIDFYPETQGNKGLALIIIQVTYYRG